MPSRQSGSRRKEVPVRSQDGVGREDGIVDVDVKVVESLLADDCRR